MTEQDWLAAGFVREFLSPGSGCWAKSFPNGAFIQVTGTGDNDCDYPAEDGPFQIGLHTPQGWEMGPSVFFEIGRNSQSRQIADEINIKALMIPLLKSLEPSLMALPSAVAVV